MWKAFPILLSGLLLCLAACRQEDVDPEGIPLGKGYFPLDSGHFVLYEVKDIDYQVFGSDTSHFQLRQTLAGSYRDPNTGDLLYRLERSKRPDSTAPWSDTVVVWSAVMGPQHLSIREDNIPFVKLIFPPKAGATWDGNRLNDIGRDGEFKPEDEYTYDYVGRTESIGPFRFQDVAKVVQDSVRSLTNDDVRIEKYAKGVGMVSAHYRVVNFLQENGNIDTTQIESGFETWYEIADYGSR